MRQTAQDFFQGQNITTGACVGKRPSFPEKRGERKQACNERRAYRWVPASAKGRAFPRNAARENKHAPQQTYIGKRAHQREEGAKKTNNKDVGTSCVTSIKRIYDKKVRGRLAITHREGINGAHATKGERIHSENRSRA